MNRNKCTQWLWIAGIAALAAILLLFLYRTGFFASAGSLSQMRAYIERFSPFSYIIYFLIQLASVIAAPIPSNITSLAGAALFGTLPAFLLTYLAVTLGSALVFQLARQMGRPLAERFVSRRNVEKYMEIIKRKQDVFFAITFLLPGFPDDILCFLAGLTDISFKRFLMLVLLCRPWGLLVACAVGGNALRLPPAALAVLCAVGLLLFIVTMKFGDRWEEAFLHKLKKESK